MARSVASSISLSCQRERVVTRLQQLLEERRKLLAERRLQMERWRALLATSRVLASEPMPTPIFLARPRRLAMHVPTQSERQGSGSRSAESDYLTIVNRRLEA